MTNVAPWYITLITGLFDRGEWGILLATLAITFALTYSLKLFYFSIINEPRWNPHHIRLLAVLAGFLAALMVWPHKAISMDWYAAGLLMGPLSILLHHALAAAAKKWAPWLYRALRGWRP